MNDAHCRGSVVAALPRLLQVNSPHGNSGSVAGMSQARNDPASPRSKPSNGDALERLVGALRDPRRYPHPVERVETVETHISRVLLTGRYAYKLKKPLELGFLDFSTLAARRAACEEELRLNRRTAPALYLEVVAITGTPENPRIGGEGPAIEYAVRMAQFPQEALLDHLAARGALDGALIERLAAAIAQFHAGAAVAGPQSAFGSPEEVLAPARQNFEQLVQMLDDPALATLRDWTGREHARLEERFARRKREGFVRECHGDLHLGNIVLLAGEPTPFDCIEFNAALRWTDLMNEVAFLVMDLEDHGLAALARRFLNAYLEETGDYAGLAVLPFYLVYRALVRAKIAAIRAHQPGLDVHGRTRAETEIHGYLRLAQRLSQPRRRALVITHGLSASGKSSAALALVEASGALRIRSDVERKRMHGLGATQRSGAALGGGIYAEDATRLAYERLATLARKVLEGGFAVVVDATFLSRAQREAFARLARQLGVPFAIASCQAPAETLRGRILARQGDAAEATLAVLERQLATQDALGEDELERALVIEPGQRDFAQALARRAGLA